MERINVLQLGTKLVNFANVTYVDIEPLEYTTPEVLIGFVGGGTLRVSAEHWNAARVGRYLPVDITSRD